MPLDARAVAYEIVRTIRTVLGGGGPDAVRTALLSIEDQARGIGTRSGPTCWAAT